MPEEVLVHVQLLRAQWCGGQSHEEDRQYELYPTHTVISSLMTSTNPPVTGRFSRALLSTGS